MEYNLAMEAEIMNKRTIFHADINHCYAQIEEMKSPKLREVPMAVGGHEETRHGIILAKNDLAKKCGIKTGETLREAYEKCPELLILPPDYDAYIYYTGKVKDIYRRYSDQVEGFGLDEAWTDYTDSAHLFGNAEDMAAFIQKQVLEETGLTVSIGVSWNKAFAKLGSDMKKPYGLTIITPENYRQKVWPLPVEDLLYVGPASAHKLHRRAISTIGDLACYPVRYLKENMGVAGEVIWSFANGMDPGIVQKQDYSVPIKSAGNSMTLIHDVHSLEELRPVYYVLCECVASRLRDAGMEGNVVSVCLRSAGLDWFMRQMKIPEYTDVSDEVMKAAMHIVEESYDFSQPLRAAGVSVSGLRPLQHHRQLSLFEDAEDHDKDRILDQTADLIREKYGFYSLRRACTLIDRPLSEFNPKADHTVHPVGYFQGRRMSG